LIPADETINFVTRFGDDLWDARKIDAITRGKLLEEYFAVTDYKDWVCAGIANKYYDFIKGNEVISLKMYCSFLKLGQVHCKHSNLLNIQRHHYFLLKDLLQLDIFLAEYHQRGYFQVCKISP